MGHWAGQIVLLFGCLSRLHKEIVGVAEPARPRAPVPAALSALSGYYPREQRPHDRPRCPPCGCIAGGPATRGVTISDLPREAFRDESVAMTGG